MKYILLVITALQICAVFCEEEVTYEQYKEKVLEPLAVWREKVEAATLEALGSIIDEVPQVKGYILKDIGEVLREVLDLPYESVEVLTKLIDLALESSDYEMHLVVSKMAKLVMQNLAESSFGHIIEAAKRKLAEDPGALLGLLASESKKSD